MNINELAEIEALKAAKIRAYNNGVEDGRKPDTNNEPVAWMMKSNDPDYVSDYIMFKKPERKDKISHQAVPLYTHPVKEHFEDEPQAEELHEIMQSNAELTDEEIYKLYEESYLEISHTTSEFDPVYFARAILRKVQEK